MICCVDTVNPQGSQEWTHRGYDTHPGLEGGVAAPSRSQ